MLRGEALSLLNEGLMVINREYLLGGITLFNIARGFDDIYRIRAVAWSIDLKYADLPTPMAHDRKR